MSKQTLTIELDVPEGYELTGEYRKAKDGETYFDAGAVARIQHDATDFNYPILRKAWQPPAWLPDGCWVFNGWGDSWFVSLEEPTKVGGNGFYTSPAPHHYVLDCEKLAKFYGDTFTPPPVDKFRIKRDA